MMEVRLIFKRLAHCREKARERKLINERAERRLSCIELLLLTEQIRLCSYLLSKTEVNISDVP